MDNLSHIREELRTAEALIAGAEKSSSPGLRLKQLTGAYHQANGALREALALAALARIALTARP